MKRAASSLLVAIVACGDASTSPPSDTDAGSSTGDAQSSGSTLVPGDPTGSSSAAESDDSDGAPPPDVPPPATSQCDAMLTLVDALARAGDVDEEAWLVAMFLDDVTWGETGFPIVEDERTCLFHLDAPGLELSVAGDFNDWVADDVAMQPADAELGVYTAVVEQPRADAVGLYKLVQGGTEFFADPQARRFGWDEFGEYSLFAVDPTRSHYERWPQFAEAVGELDPRDVTVFLPAGAFAREDLPILVMHDGQNLFAPEAFFGGWKVGATIDAATAAGELAPVVVVGIDNTPDRMDEYTHVADDLGGMLVGGRADEYAAFVVDGVLPFVVDRYPVTDDPARTATLGSSLGGLVSLYIGWAHAERFGHVGSMSGTVGWGSFGAGEPTMLDLYSDAPPLGLSIYIDSGGGPGFGCPDGDADNYCDNVAFADGLRDLGWTDDVDLVYRFAPDAPHNEAAWAERLGPALIDWFPGP